MGEQIILAIYGGAAKGLLDTLAKKDGVSVRDRRGIEFEGKEWHFGKVGFSSSMSEDMKPLVAVYGDERSFPPDIEYAVIQGDFPLVSQLDYERYCR